MKKNLISWKAYDYKYEKKSADWYWVLYVVFLTTIGIFTYFFHDWIFSGMLLMILIVITIASVKKPNLRKYEIDSESFHLDDSKKIIKFDNVESYFVDEWNHKILVNTKNKYSPLVLIPFEENQNMKKVDSFLQKHLKKNPELRIPTIELVFSILFGL